jgi:hypothetical protein
MVPGPSITLQSLRAACNALPYSGQLIASGGQEPYTYRLSTTSDFTLGSDGALSGTPLGAGLRSLRVEVVDAEATTVEVPLRLQVREHCWVAYLSRETGTSRLHLTDVRATTRKVFPALAEGAREAFDFAFSPDGRFLAFRAGADAASAALYLLNPDASEAQVVPFAAPVAAYAWSGNGEYLAVILRGAGDDWFLSGLEVPDAVPGSSIEPGDLWPLQATNYRRELGWIGDAAVVYVGQAFSGSPPEPDLQETVYVAGRLSTGFTAPRPSGDIRLEQADGKLFETRNGVIALQSQTAPDLVFFQTFFPTEGDVLRSNDAAVLWLDDSETPALWWSDDRQYVARLDAQRRLELFSIDSEERNALSELPCGEVVAWRTLADRERIVCVESGGCVEATERPQLRVFDFFPGSRALAERDIAGCAQTRFADDAPRSISSAGNWLVFDTGMSFSTASLGGTLRLPTSTATSSRAPGDRAYLVSPDESALLWQAGDRLWWKSPLQDSPEEDELTNLDAAEGAALRAMTSPDRCEPAFLSSPERWCGGATLHDNARWSADSLSVLFKAASGTLWVADTSVRDARALVQPLSSENASCANGCLGAFDFQP